MSDFRKNYFEAREVVAQELKEKYNLVESYKDDNRLTLDSSNHSIHLIFYVPDGINFSISKKGEHPLSKDSYFGHISQGKDNMNEIEEVLKNNASLFPVISKDLEKYEVLNNIRFFHICLAFFESEYSKYFN